MKKVKKRRPSGSVSASTGVKGSRAALECLALTSGPEVSASKTAVHKNSAQYVSGAEVEINELAVMSPLAELADLEVSPDAPRILELIRQDALNIPPEYIHLEFHYAFSLDDQGVRFLEYYREKYCTFISIGTDSLNYFLKTFLNLAATNESILYALTAWGGFYFELNKVKSDFTKPWSYMQKAAKLMCAQVGDELTPRNNDDFFVLFAFYLIFIGIEVCTGDVRHWGGFLKQCSAMIRAHGGLKSVCSAFSNCNDIKWLISDFQFHDMLSSNALMKGTLFSITEYEAVLPEDSNYGIDPLQGTIGPIYNLLGDIGNAKVELRRKWNQLDVLDLPSRIEYYRQVEETNCSFRRQIDACVPSETHMRILAEDPAETELQMALFDLYIGVCRIQLALQIMQVPPLSIEQQKLLVEALQVIDMLLPTRVKVSLSMLLLVCGLMCCTEHDRAEMRSRFRTLLQDYEIGNFQRIVETVEEAWARNPRGNRVVDWAELAERKGWNLYVG